MLFLDVSRLAPILMGAFVAGACLTPVAQNNAKDPWAADFAIGRPDRCASAEVYLGLLARLGLHAAKRRRRFLQHPGDIPSHAVVAWNLVAVFGGQVLMDPLGQKTLVELGQDFLAERLAFANRSARWRLLRAGGRVWPNRDTYLPTVSRSIPRRAAISRLECSVVWSVRILSISAIVSRFAIHCSFSKRLLKAR